MHTIKNKYIGDLRTTSIHLSSGNEIITDAPIDNQGKGEAFSPTDLLASSLASCMLTIMGIAARNRGINICGTEVFVQKIMESNPRRVKEIVVEFFFPDEYYSEVDKKVLEQAASSCPVALSLNTEITQTKIFNYKN